MYGAARGRPGSIGINQEFSQVDRVFPVISQFLQNQIVDLAKQARAEAEKILAFAVEKQG